MTQPPQPADQQQAAAFAALVTAQAASRAQLTSQAVAIARASAQGFTGWYDSEAITVWSSQLATRVEAIQRALATLTDAYLARALSMLVAGRVRPSGRVDVAGLRQGVTHAGAYARAADTYRWQQSKFDALAVDLASGGTPSPLAIVDPVAAAVERVASVADMDAQLAVQAQSQAVMESAAESGVVTGYRRVIHPELSKSGTCGLCVAASDRLYGPHEPMPLHARCECTTLPVLDGADPGSTLNSLDLRRLYKAVGGTQREKLTAARYQVDEHGELGPILTRSGQPIRTARQAARDTGKAARAKSPEQVAAALRRTRQSLTAALPRARELAAQDPKTWGRYLTQLEARISDLDHQLAA